MKKKYISIALLVVGIALICLSVVLAVASTSEKNIIGGADWPTFRYVFFSEHGGILSFLSLCGVVSILAAVEVRFGKRKS